TKALNKIQEEPRFKIILTTPEDWLIKNLNTNPSQSTITPRPRSVKNWKKKKKDTLLGILEKLFVGYLRNRKIFNEIQNRFLGRKPSYRRKKKIERPKKEKKKTLISRIWKKKEPEQTDQDIEMKKQKEDLWYLKKKRKKKEDIEEYSWKKL
ncbi:18124_t:CDS:2, partial [Racocetra persica]